MLPASHASCVLAELEESGSSQREEGERIYAQKPNLGANGITWSQENYAHLGLQVDLI